MSEHERARAAREHELRDMATISRILASGSDTERKEVQALYKLTNEQMESFCYWAQMRAHQIKSDGKSIGREKTQEEKELGVFIEYIEPQVLDAVRTLRKKGYKTRYSGFEEFGSQQTMWLDEDQSEAPFPLPEAAKMEIEKRWGVTIKIEPGKIWIDCLETRLSADDLKSMWNDIVQAVPPYRK